MCFAYSYVAFLLLMLNYLQVQFKNIYILFKYLKIYTQQVHI